MWRWDDMWTVRQWTAMERAKESRRESRREPPQSHHRATQQGAADKR